MRHSSTQGAPADERIQKYDRAKAPAWLRRFCPNERVENVTDLSPDHFAGLGIKAIGLDLDNTLTPWKSHDLGHGIEDWILSLRQAGIKMVLISNSRRKKRLSELSRRLDIPYVQGRMKPSVEILEAGLRECGVQPAEMAMVGDQMFTDVWGGNRAGMYTIWVRPMHPREFVGTKVSRQVERVVARLLSRCRE